MKHALKLSLLFFAFYIGSSFLFANTVSFETKEYKGSIIYNDKVKPGEVVFARLTMRINHPNEKEPKACIQLFRDSKKIDSSNFYFINDGAQRKKTPDMWTSLPVSPWLSGSNEYYLRVIFSAKDKIIKEVFLPFEIENYIYPEEEIKFDEKNSQIKQNMSAERLLQIEKLNNLLETINPSTISNTSPWIKPVKSNRKTSNYGDRRTYKYTNGKSETSLHYGIDYGVPEGTDVAACSTGKIVMAEFRISTGWTVVIEHLPGLYSLYYHLKSLNVKTDDFVPQGKIIGKSGSTGLATGPHLHWEVRLNTCPVNPESFICDWAFENAE